MSRVCTFATRRWPGAAEPPAFAGAAPNPGLGPYGWTAAQAAPYWAPPQGPTPASSVASKAAGPTAPGGPSLQVPGLKVPFPVSRGLEAAPFAASAATGFATVPQAAAWGACGAEELTWPQSFGDVSTVMCHSEEATGALRMPAQFRPASEWEPATPCGGEEPPAYEAPPVVRPTCAPGLLAPPPGRSQEGCKRLGKRGACTQPFASAIVNGGEEFVYGGQEIGQYTRVPTPVRACYSGGAAGVVAGTAVGHRDAAVQANRHSIDGHCSAAAAAAEDPGVAKEPTTRKRLASLIRQTGAPHDDGNGGVGIDAGSPAKNSRVSGASSAGGGLRELRYPKVVVPMDCEGGDGGADPAPVVAWQGRVTLAQAMSAAVAEEVAELERAWRLDGGSIDCEMRAEKVVAQCLRKIAKRSEKACVMEALKPAAGEAMAALGSAPPEGGSPAQHDLEAELIAAEERIAALKRIEGELAKANEAEVMCKDVQELVEKLSSNRILAGSGPGVPPLGELEAGEAAGRLEQCLQRVAVADLWVHHTVAKLEDYDRDCAERERAAAGKAWARSGEGPVAAAAALPNPQRVLMGIR